MSLSHHRVTPSSGLVRYLSPTLCAVQIEQLVINVSWRVPLSRGDWSGYVTAVRRAAEGWRKGDVTGVLCYVPFAAPNGAMRAELVAPPLGRALDMIDRVAVCTDSTLVRGAMTALSWMARASTTLKPFQTDDKDLALRWLSEVARFDSAIALNELQQLILHLRAG